MKSGDKLPTLENIPNLLGNIEGLKKHSFMQMFLSEHSISQENLKLRNWLLHTISSASRHYSKARELVKLQDNADQSRDGGAIFYILEVSEEIEACVTSTYRACMALQRLKFHPEAQIFVAENEASIAELRSIRNQFDHMHSQITSDNIGNGPISITFGDKGKSIKFRKLVMPTANLSNLIDEAYRVIASFYPAFNVDSEKEVGGPIKLSMNLSITEIDGNGVEREVG